MTPPLRFCFGLHLHQPVGNFDQVFQQHLDEVYRPLVRALMAGEAWPVALHISGPLLEWLESRASGFLDEIGQHARDGRIELLAAGHDEPILAVLSAEDRLEQVRRHREHLWHRFGVEVHGLWLTERVWEPTLPETLQPAGIDFALVDDRHFRVSGFAQDRLHQHFLTESGGARVSLFPIDEQLRYLIPFRPASELAEHFRTRRAAGDTLAILADDGEKFGGWPGTADWLYRDGWLEDFLRTMRHLRDNGEVTLTRFDDALRQTPSGGLAYLPTASYHEMEGWSLPTEPARALHAIEEELGARRLAGLEGGLVRGGHWRHFMVKYPEANRLHKMMLRLSRLSRERSAGVDVRRAIGRAQCNDAYWHGVFGGLYLSFLRGAIWHELANAEAMMRPGEALAIEQLDYDADGWEEVLITSSTRSVVVAPARGGAIEVLLDLTSRQNLINVLTRHREAYHLPPLTPEGGVAEPKSDGTASIHELETQLTEVPPVDQEVRALFVDRLVGEFTGVEHFIAGSVDTIHSWGRSPLQALSAIEDGIAVVRMQDDTLNKTLRFLPDGAIECEWQWHLAPANAWFTTEISYSSEFTIDAPGAQGWDYPIETVSRSERGFDRTNQGHAVVLRWPVGVGRAMVTLKPQA